jgi:hypothetical protein
LRALSSIILLIDAELGDRTSRVCGHRLRGRYAPDLCQMRQALSKAAAVLLAATECGDDKPLAAGWSTACLGPTHARNATRGEGGRRSDRGQKEKDKIMVP